MRISEVPAILFFTGAPALAALYGWRSNRCTWREGFRERPHCRNRVLAQRHHDGLSIMRLQRLYVAGCLGPCESAKGNCCSRDREIGTHLIDELQEYSAILASFMELACGMEIARSVAGRRGHMVMGHERSS